MDIGHAFLLHPDIAEFLDASTGSSFVEGLDEIIPTGIVELMIYQESVQTILHSWSPHHLFHHAHHNWSLVVDDVIVEQAGMIQVVQLLCDSMGTICAVNGNCGILEGFEEVQVMVYAFVLASSDL